MEINILLTNLEDNLNDIEAESLECIHLSDSKGNVIHTILAPRESDEESLSSKKMLNAQLDQIVQEYTRKDNDVRSIATSILLPNIFLAEYYFKKIKAFCASCAAQSFQINFKDSRAVSRSPLSSFFRTRMSILSIYFLKYQCSQEPFLCIKNYMIVIEIFIIK